MICELFAKYQFGAIGLHNADITDGKVANRAFILANLRYSVIYSHPLFALFNHRIQVKSATSRLGDIQLGDNSGQLGDNSGQIGDIF